MSLIFWFFNMKVGVTREHSVFIINMVPKERIVYLLVLYAVTWVDFSDKNNFVGSLKLSYW